jgi:lipoprotein-anchoring transpeptidase ErfK/SrfK
MAVLRQLGVIYIAAASAFTVAIALDQHPDWAAAARVAVRYTGDAGTATAVALNDYVVRPGWVLVRRESAQGYDALVEALTAPPQPQPSPVAKAKPVQPKRVAEAGPSVRPSPRPARKTPAPKVIARRTAPKVVARVRRPPHVAAVKPRTKVTRDVAPPKTVPLPQAPALPAPSAGELARVKNRLQDTLTSALYANFDLFLYVSKAEKGPLAQRMYVFAKDTSDGLALRYDWPVSTGREKVEYNKAGWKLPSFTPQGYYELDPHRMYRRYRSIQWGTPMPYAMFFNWVHDGNMTGLAIHAAHGDDIALLGRRASGGCIHLAPEDARLLFDLIRTRYKGRVPRFAYDRKTHTMANDGLLMRGRNGKLRFKKGYRVLVVIENFGGENVVATLM